MKLRFRKRVKVAPGVGMNVSLKGVSATVGARGASVNVGKNGVYANAGVPGTGVSARTKITGGKIGKARQNQVAKGSSAGTAVGVLVVLGISALLVGVLLL